jgi:hypothetical protein
MGWRRADIGGEDVWFRLVTLDVRWRCCPGDRVQPLQYASGACAVVERHVGQPQPRGCVGVLTSVFANTGRICLDVARIAWRAVERRPEQSDEPFALVHELPLGGQRRVLRTLRIGAAAEGCPRLRECVNAALVVLP